MRNFNTFRFDSDKIAVEIDKNINKVKFYETPTDINVEYVDEVIRWENNDEYHIVLDEDVPEAIAKMIASSLQSYAGGETKIERCEHAEDDGYSYEIIWNIDLIFFKKQ